MQVVQDMMSDRLEVVGPKASLRDVLKTMNHTGYRHIPVVENSRLIGIITDRDIRLAVNLTDHKDNNERSGHPEGRGVSRRCVSFFVHASGSRIALHTTPHIYRWSITVFEP